MPSCLASHRICELYRAIFFPHNVFHLSTKFIHSSTLPVHHPFESVMGKSEWKQGLLSSQCYLSMQISCWLQIAPRRRIQRQMTSRIPPPPEVHALKNLRISIFIRVLPISVSRILATQHTTMMANDGWCRCKEDNTFSDFTLARPTERNLDDRPRDI